MEVATSASSRERLRLARAPEVLEIARFLDAWTAHAWEIASLALAAAVLLDAASVFALPRARLVDADRKAPSNANA